MRIGIALTLPSDTDIVNCLVKPNDIERETCSMVMGKQSYL